MQKTILTKNSKIAIIITAAGSSTRMGGPVKKEYLPLNNGTVLSNCAISFLNALYKSVNISNFVVTFPNGSGERGREESRGALLSGIAAADYKKFLEDKTIFVEGGSSRQASVYNGLLCLKQQKEQPDYVLIHDGARPFVTSQIINDVLEAAVECGASVPGVTPVDTQKEVDKDGFIVRHLIRSELTAVQTPQGFEFGRLIEAHGRAAQDGIEYTDDTHIWGNYIGKVKVVKGDVANKKITFPGDIS